MGQSEKKVTLNNKVLFLDKTHILVKKIGHNNTIHTYDSDK